MIHSSCAQSVMIPGDYLLRTTRSWYECEDDRSRIWAVSFRRIYYGEPHIYVSWMFNVLFCSLCIFGETWYCREDGSAQFFGPNDPTDSSGGHSRKPTHHRHAQMHNIAFAFKEIAFQEMLFQCLSLFLKSTRYWPYKILFA